MTLSLLVFELLVFRGLEFEHAWDVLLVGIRGGGVIQASQGDIGDDLIEIIVLDVVEVEKVIVELEVLIEDAEIFGGEVGDTILANSEVVEVGEPGYESLFLSIKGLPEAVFGLDFNG